MKKNVTFYSYKYYKKKLLCITDYKDVILFKHEILV
jgi:hypothetical protein